MARDEGKERVRQFVSNHAPRYRPVLAKMEALGMTVDPLAKDQDLEAQLHRELQKLEADSLAQGHAIFSEDGSAPPEGYAERLAEYLATVSDFNQ